MNTRVFGFILFLSALLTVIPSAIASQTAAKEISPSPANTSAIVGKDYLIGAGDVLALEVWKDPNLTRLLVVLADGKVNIPLIGEVSVANRTITDVKKELEERLSRFVPEPVLTLEVEQCNSLFIYVLGRVNNPGRTALVTTVNVLQALAIHGGLNPFARRNQIKIFRSENGKQRIIPFHYDEVTMEERVEENIDLMRGDVIFVP
ncbi:MAG TPA: polysaccharide biosynthesis/export family protein [Geobacteraceae bacterium]|nr:polysaccharide biosynthesis/export family protein [Geobacteraceae bacterium]